jgi:hypothetical protein
MTPIPQNVTMAKGIVMTTIAIIQDKQSGNGASYRVIAGQRHSVGKTAGEALDALTSQLADEQTGTLVVIQHMRPDRYFTAEQQQRLEELMVRWRAARDSQAALPTEEQAELEALIAAELQAATKRAADLAGQFKP